MTEAWVVGCRDDSLGKGRARGGGKLSRRFCLETGASRHAASCSKLWECALRGVVIRGPRRSLVFLPFQDLFGFSLCSTRGYYDLRFYLNFTRFPLLFSLNHSCMVITAACSLSTMEERAGPATPLRRSLASTRANCRYRSQQE